MPRVINSKLSRRRRPTRCIIGGAEAERPSSLGGDNKEEDGGETPPPGEFPRLPKDGQGKGDEAPFDPNLAPVFQ